MKSRTSSYTILFLKFYSLLAEGLTSSTSCVRCLWTQPRYQETHTHTPQHTHTHGHKHTHPRINIHTYYTKVVHTPSSISSHEKTSVKNFVPVFVNSTGKYDIFFSFEMSMKKETRFHNLMQKSSVCKK